MFRSESGVITATWMVISGGKSEVGVGSTHTTKPIVSAFASLIDGASEKLYGIYWQQNKEKWGNVTGCRLVGSW
jgi:hypothetical protein